MEKKLEVINEKSGQDSDSDNLSRDQQRISTNNRSLNSKTPDVLSADEKEIEANEEE